MDGRSAEVEGLQCSLRALGFGLNLKTEQYKVASNTGGEILDKGGKSCGNPNYPSTTGKPSGGGCGKMDFSA